MSEPRPASVKADRTKLTVTIIWDDGHQSVYSYAGLRKVCPCAVCKGGHEHMGEPPDPVLVKEAMDLRVNLEKIEPVGSYALQFHWTPHHNAGLYTWKYLRAACPCPICLP